uniref:CS domain-containing protein n=1 Tax=Arcella intermedia TaxID=1963864 RepID=A0A6B2LPJ5_9EUKA
MAVKGKVLVEGALPHDILPDGSTWTIESETGSLDVLFQKPPHTENPVWWKHIAVGEPVIDVEAIEASKYLDDSILRKIKESKKEKAKMEAEGKTPPTEQKPDDVHN